MQLWATWLFPGSKYVFWSKKFPSNIAMLVTWQSHGRTVGVGCFEKHSGLLLHKSFYRSNEVCHDSRSDRHTFSMWYLFPVKGWKSNWVEPCINPFYRVSLKSIWCFKVCVALNPGLKIWYYIPIEILRTPLDLSI